MKVIDVEFKKECIEWVNIIFCCVLIVVIIVLLLNLIFVCFFNGLGNDSGEFGYNLMDYYFWVGVMGELIGFVDDYNDGDRFVGFYILCFWNFDDKE